MAWLNDDGLYIKFGTELGQSTVDAGDYKTFNGAGESVLEIELDLTTLTDASAIINDVVWLPKNAQIRWIEVTAEEAALTGTSFDLGLIHEDRTTTTGVGVNVLLDGFPASGNYDAVGDTVKFMENDTIPTGATGTGSLVGAVLPDNSDRYYVTALYDTGSAFTAGKLRLRIGYMPSVG